MRKWSVMVVAIGVALSSASVHAAQATTLTVLGHSSFNLDKQLIQQFEKANNVSVKIVKGGDAGEMLNKLILSKRAPIADVVYGIDNTLISRANAAGVLAPYVSPALKNVSTRYRIDPAARLTPVDYGYVALNYDKAYFAGQTLPKTLDDLRKPQYARLLVTENPNTSSPGLAFLLASIAHYGEPKVWQFWADLRDGGVAVSQGWTEAYYTEFSRNGGKRPIVVSYSSSPAAEVFYSEKPLDASPTANLFLKGSTFLQVEGIGLVKGSKNSALGKKFIDFMLSKEVQSSFPTDMWVYPVISGVTLDKTFKYANTPTNTQQLSPASIEKNLNVWLEKWNKVMLRGVQAKDL